MTRPRDSLSPYLSPHVYDGVRVMTLAERAQARNAVAQNVNQRSVAQEKPTIATDKLAPEES